MFEQWKNDDERKEAEDEILRPIKRRMEERRIAKQSKIDVDIAPRVAQVNQLKARKEAAEEQLAKEKAALVAQFKRVADAEALVHSCRWDAVIVSRTIESDLFKKMQLGSPLIIEFQSEMNQLLDKHRNAGRDEFREGRRNLITGKTKRTLWTNRPAINRAISFLRAAIDTAESMRSLPLTDVEVTERLDVLRKGIPDVGEWVMVEVKQAFLVDNTPPRYGGEIRMPPEF